MMNINQNLANLRTQRPVVLNITNSVAMDFSANALLALGASPIMSADIREIPELVNISSAVVINMGTISPEWSTLAETAAMAARKSGRPLVFDPVGSGATSLRTGFAREFAKRYAPEVIRGNLTEILSIFEDGAKTRGVDAGPVDAASLPAATSSADQPQNRVISYSVQSPSVLVASGPEDIIAASGQSWTIQNGHEMMTKVTAMGCVATCIIAAFASVCSPAEAALSGMAVMGIAGEQAASHGAGPGSLRMTFLDRLAAADLNFDRHLRMNHR